MSDALERIADAIECWVKLEQARFEKEYPIKKVEPASIGVAKYANPELDKPEEAGDVFPEPVGPREAKILANKQRQAKRGA